MAAINVTAEKLQGTIKDVQEWLALLERTAAEMPKWCPEGIDLAKTKPVGEHLTALLEFTHQVRAAVGRAKNAAEWGKPELLKRQEREKAKRAEQSEKSE